jgi:uncharacterized protein
MSKKDSQGFKLSLHELPRRSGEYRDYQMQVLLDRPFGVEMIAIPAGTEIDLTITATSVDEGVLIRGRVNSNAVGECSRCLDPVEMDINQGFDELYEYESKAAALSDEDVETDQILIVVEDHVDLEIPVRDAVVLALPVNPLCDPECLGLCSICGVPYRELEPDHEHEERDPRWGPLADLARELEAGEK